jgi:hypothetical protein
MKTRLEQKREKKYANDVVKLLIIFLFTRNIESLMDLKFVYNFILPLSFNFDGEKKFSPTATSEEVFDSFSRFIVDVRKLFT